MRNKENKYFKVERGEENCFYIKTTEAFNGEISMADIYKLKALVHSKWKYIIEVIKTLQPEYINDGGGTTCAFCQVFPRTCEGCPVYVHVGLSQCKGTPYRYWDDVSLNKKVSWQEKLRAAERMLEFLKEV